MDLKKYVNVSAQHLARMVEVSRILNSTTDLPDLLSYILNEVVALTDAESASILLLDHQTRELRFKAASHGMPEKMMDLAVPLDGSIAGAIFRNDAPLNIADVTADQRWHSNIDDEIEFKTRSIVGVPMHDAANRTMGVLEAINKLEGSFSEADTEILTILADIAGVAVEKARLIDALKQANQRLSELDELKTNFISIASHELRTPLSIILGYVSFLRESADPLMAEQMDSVLNAAIRLRSLIQDMLNLGYVDSGDVTLETEPVDLTGLISSFLRSRRESAAAQQQTIYFPDLTRAVYVDGDRKMLELIFGNLLDNAFKYTPQGGEVTVAVEERSDEIWIRVADSGIGIPNEQLERIFDRFHQVEHPLTRQYEGMGLGLAIARDLTELHNGRIWVYSKVGEGSEFFVALPNHSA